MLSEHTQENAACVQATETHLIQVRSCLLKQCFFTLLAASLFLNNFVAHTCSLENMLLVTCRAACLHNSVHLIHLVSEILGAHPNHTGRPASPLGFNQLPTWHLQLPLPHCHGGRTLHCWCSGGGAFEAGRARAASIYSAPAMRNLIPCVQLKI